jgi:hypothetical protein
MTPPWRTRWLAAITFPRRPAHPLHPAVARILELPILRDKLL